MDMKKKTHREREKTRKKTEWGRQQEANDLHWVLLYIPFSFLLPILPSLRLMSLCVIVVVRLILFFFFYLNCCYSLMCFVLCDDAADVDANADAMNCFFLYWARRSLPLQFIRRPDRQLYHPKRTSNKCSPIRYFLGYTHCDAIFRVIIGDFFFRFVRNRLFGFFKLFHGKPCILT